MRITPREISQKLATQAERFCRYLFPSGKVISGEFCVGSTQGEAGKSCKIRLVGAKAGLWCDFSSSDERGDLLDLLASVRGKGIGEAVKEAKGWLGLIEPSSLIKPKTYQRPPKKPAGVKSIVEADPVWEYLTKERGLSPETLKAFKIATKGREIVFPSYAPAGELENLKYIGIDRTEDGKKIIRQEPGCAPTLFGWHTIPPEAREVIITEGQIDAMTWYQIGFPALSVPSGVGDSGWIEYEWENLDRFDVIYLNFDDDEAGQKAVPEVANRLGKARCLSVVFQFYKDANDGLQAGASKDEFSSAIVSAKPFTPKQIKAPHDYREDVQEYFHPKSGVKPGFFPQLFNRDIGFRPGELTVWTGVSGHGKSVLISMIMLYAAHFGQRAAIASMEMTGTQTLSRMVCQMTRYHTPEKEIIDYCIDWMSGKLWIYDVMGNVDPKILMELMDYSRARHMVDHFVIDSLMKCNVRSDDYDAQRVFVDGLATFAKQSGSHVHLVAHARKGKDEHAIVGKLDIKGSGDIFGQADNCITVWRNKAKEEDTRKTGNINDQVPDAIAYCDKQRTSGWEGEIPLWYFQKCFLYMTTENGKPHDLPLGPAGIRYNPNTHVFE